MDESYYDQGYRKGYNTGFWIGAVSAFFATVGILFLIGRYVPL